MGSAQPDQEGTGPNLGGRCHAAGCGGGGGGNTWLNHGGRHH